MYNENRNMKMNRFSRKYRIKNAEKYINMKNISIFFLRIPKF